MRRDNVILWFGRLFTIVFTVAIAWDALADGALSREIRQVTIGIVGAVFALLFAWQVRISWRYEGMPLIPLPFRWVTALWFASLALFVLWNLLINRHSDWYTEYRSAVVWWQVGASTMWWASRWVAVETIHEAGAGETGANPGNGNGGAS